MWLKCSKSKRINFTCKCTLNSEEKGMIGVAVFPWEGILRPTGLLSYVQTDATTPGIVGPTMLGVVASVCMWLKV